MALQSNSVRLFWMLLFVSILAGGSGLKCYTCLSSPLARDEACEMGKSTLPVADCFTGYKYCMVSKIQTPATVFTRAGLTVTRSCSPTNTPGQQSDGTFQFCQNELCNKAGSNSIFSLVTLITCIIVPYMAF